MTVVTASEVMVALEFPGEIKAIGSAVRGNGIVHISYLVEAGEHHP